MSFMEYHWIFFNNFRQFLRAGQYSGRLCLCLFAEESIISRISLHSKVNSYIKLLFVLLNKKHVKLDLILFFVAIIWRKSIKSVNAYYSKILNQVYYFSSGVTAVDIHPGHPHMLAVGLSDGNVAVYNLQKNSGKPAYMSTAKNGKHQDIVWQVWKTLLQ